MCYYNKYSNTITNVVQQQPTLDEETGMYIAICATTHALSSENLEKAQSDAQENIVSLENYNATTAKQELQQIVQDITSAMS